MLKYRLLHPPLLAALGRCGHGTRLLVTDSNYPAVTGAPPAAERIYLNLAPGLIGATDLLEVLLSAVPVESATIMLTAEGAEAPVVAEYRARLPAGVTVTGLPRFDFYEAARSPDTALVIATGEQRQYANLLLVVGVITAQGEVLY
jgi:L-fucose mutarotase